MITDPLPPGADSDAVKDAYRSDIDRISAQGATASSTSYGWTTGRTGGAALLRPDGLRPLRQRLPVFEFTPTIRQASSLLTILLHELEARPTR
ncbi:hypothetical protein O1L68_16935 [Streptomyces lydicus]|nr:hypothetical protein [Streptomyces lydicus]MCZ1008152.1 hypothetical protein [Streptomyces lydicus]